MRTQTTLSADAIALADELTASEDGCALTILPAHERPGHRARLLTSIGTAISDLRADGWLLAVQTFRGVDLELEDQVELVLAVTVERWPEGHERASA